MAGQRVELLDAGLDVVPGDPFAGGDGGQVDVLDDPLVVAEHLVGQVQAAPPRWAGEGQVFYEKKASSDCNNVQPIVLNRSITIKC